MPERFLNQNNFKDYIINDKGFVSYKKIHFVASSVYKGMDEIEFIIKEFK